MEKPHKRLNVWKTSMDLVVEVYRLTENFPSREVYVLAQQARRSALSIPSNIAEGAGRQTKKEFINFLHIAQGSLSELDTQIELAERLGYLNSGEPDSLKNRMEQVSRMITGLIRQQKGVPKG